MSIRQKLGGLARSVREQLRRKPKEAPTANGYHGAVLRTGMLVVARYGQSGAPMRITRVFPRSNEIEMLYEDGVRATFGAENFVPARRRRS